MLKITSREINERMIRVPPGLVKYCFRVLTTWLKQIKSVNTQSSRNHKMMKGEKKKKIEEKRGRDREKERQQEGEG